jgi:hypothetical protein
MPVAPEMPASGSLRQYHRRAIGHHVGPASEAILEGVGEEPGAAGRRRAHHQPGQALRRVGFAHALEGQERLGVGESGAAVEQPDHPPALTFDFDGRLAIESLRFDAPAARQVDANDRHTALGVLGPEHPSDDQPAVHRFGIADRHERRAGPGADVELRPVDVELTADQVGRDPQIRLHSANLVLEREGQRPGAGAAQTQRADRPDVDDGLQGALEFGEALGGQAVDRGHHREQADHESEKRRHQHGAEGLPPEIEKASLQPGRHGVIPSRRAARRSKPRPADRSGRCR